MTWKRHIPSVVACLLVIASFGQDPQFSQFHASPLYLNPALTGNTAQERLSASYRMQWTGFPKGFETYAVSYDHNAAKANSGYGFMVLHDNAGSNNLSFTKVAASYSYQARLDRYSGIRAGLRMGYTLRSFDASNFLFADQVIRDNAPTSLEEEGLIEQTSYLDIGVGGLYFHEAYWVGISMDHINKPDQTLTTTGSTRLPIRTSVHGGYRFALDDRILRKSKTTMTVSMHYKAQDKWDQFDVGAYIDHDKISAGVWYRGIPGLKAYRPTYANNDAVIFMMGYTTKGDLQIAYSYDMTISTLTAKSGGAHEISLTYEWPKKAKRKNHRMVPCPKF